VTLPLLLLAVLLTSTVPAFAAKASSASGSFTDTSVLYSKVTYSGTNVVYDQANAGSIDGTFSGTYTTYVHLTLNLLTGNAVYQASDVCTCSVAKKSGTLYFYEQGTITQFVLLSSTATIVQGTHQLVNLQGHIALQGLVYNQLGLTMGTYSGHVSSDSTDE
jgi:hypothetical protein